MGEVMVFVALALQIVPLVLGGGFALAKVLELAW